MLLDESERRTARVAGSRVKSPPFSAEARLEAGFLLRRLQRGEALALPHSRPTASVAKGCHELRIVDKGVNWRVMYFTDADAVVILEVFSKKTKTTPKRVIDVCQDRLRRYRETRG